MTIRDLVWLQARGRVRTPSFVRRSRLSIGACGEVAREIEAIVSRAIAPGARAEVLPPVAFEPERWRALCGDAALFAFRGERLDAMLAIDPGDARRIASRALGEDDDGADRRGPLSRIERRVLERFAREIGAGLAPLCGKVAMQPGPSGEPCATWVEVCVGAPLRIALGIAIAREPEDVAGPPLDAAALGGCRLECTASLGTGMLAAGALTALRVGDVVRLDTKVGPSATLNVGAYPVARGEGGVLGDRTAFMVRDATSGAVS